ncbi:MAG: cob(I)yrinic acid a,c-diamide adenosyltransferase [Draconibacterium sp.]
MDTGLVHIYTGEGKGKTTASVGLAVRALAHGLAVVYASFFKKPGTCGYNEVQVLKDLGATVFSFSEGMSMANRHISSAEYHLSVTSGLNALNDFIVENKVQLLVLDEILIAVQCGFISSEELIKFIHYKPAALELVLTGRGATNEIKEMADYVTYLTKEKHPYDQGITSRVGIEY